MEIQGNLAFLSKREQKKLDLPTEVMVSEVNDRINEFWPVALPPKSIQALMPQILVYEIELQESL